MRHTIRWIFLVLVCLGLGQNGISYGQAAQAASASAANDTLPENPGTLPTGLSLRGNCQSTWDLQQGQYNFYSHNPCPNRWDHNQNGLHVIYKNDTTQLFGPPITRCCVNRQYPFAVDAYFVNRGWNAGAPTYGPGNWSKGYGIFTNVVVNAQGIHEAFGGTFTKYGAGDTQLLGLTGYFNGAVVANSDEGITGTRVYVNQNDANQLYRGTVSGSYTGTSPILVNAATATNGNAIGVGTPMLDNASVMSGTVTARSKSGGAATLAIAVSSGAITPTEAYGTTTASVMVASDGDNGYTNAILPISATTGGSTGRWQVGHVIEIQGGNGFLECSVITAIDGVASGSSAGPAKLTIPLKHAYPSGSWVEQGGSTCDFLEFSNNTFNSRGAVDPTGLRYSFRVISAPDTSHLVITQFVKGVGTTDNVPASGPVILRHGCTVTDALNRRTLQPDGAQFSCETPAGGFASGASIQNDEDISTFMTLERNLFHENNPYSMYRTSSQAGSVMWSFGGLGLAHAMHTYINTNPDNFYVHNGGGPTAPQIILKSSGQTGPLYVSDHRPQLQYGEAPHTTCLICIRDKTGSGNTETSYQIWNDKAGSGETWIAYNYAANTIEFGTGPGVQMDNSASIFGPVAGFAQSAYLSSRSGACPSNYFGLTNLTHARYAIPTGISTCATLQLVNNESVVGYSDAIRWTGHTANTAVGSAGIVACASCGYNHLAYAGSYVNAAAGNLPGFGLSLQDASGHQSFPLIAGELHGAPYIDVTQGWIRFAAPTANGSSALWSERYPTMNASISYLGSDEMGIGDGTLQSKKGKWNMGTARFNGAASGTVTMQPAAATASYTVTLPAAQGAGSLVNDGSGNLSWSRTGAEAGARANAVTIAPTGTILGSAGRAICTTACDATSGRITLTPGGSGIGGTGSFATITLAHAYSNTNYTCLVTQNGYTNGINIGVAWDPTSTNVVTLKATGTGIDRNPQEIDYQCSAH